MSGDTRASLRFTTKMFELQQVGAGEVFSTKLEGADSLVKEQGPFNSGFCVLCMCVEMKKCRQSGAPHLV